MKFAQLSVLSLLLAAAEVQAWGRSSNNKSKNKDSKWNDNNNWWDSSTTKETEKSSSSSHKDDHLLLCAGYVGSLYGDPHVVTFDGSASSCQNGGEFVLVNSDEIEIQAKFKMLSVGGASVTSGLAIAQPGVDTIQVGFAEYDSGDSTTISIKRDCPIHLYVDGKLVSASVGDKITGDGYEITVSSSSVSIQFYDDGTPTSAVQVQPSIGRNTCMFTAYICLPSSDQELLDSTIGLLGTPNNDPSDDWMTSTGEPLTKSSKSSDQYEYCSTEHCVYREVDSIFVHEDAHGGDSFDDHENCSGEFPGEIDISNPDPEIVEICGEGNTDCILDGVVFGPDEARKTVEAQETTVAIHVSETVVDTEPVSSCPGDIVLLHTEGDAPYDQIPFTIVEQTTDSVTLKIRTASFEGVEIQYTEYEEDFQSKCISSESVTTAYNEEIRVTCPGTEHVTLVSIVASDSALDPVLDNAVPDECCHAGEDSNPKVKYTFMVSCVSQCPQNSRTLRGSQN